MRSLPLIAAAVTLLFAGAAVAGHCPKDAKAIDHALQSSKLDEAGKAKVMALRDEGMALHKSGSHRESEAKMAEAMRMLLMN